jgi:hypothetical protein
MEVCYFFPQKIYAHAQRMRRQRCSIGVYDLEDPYTQIFSSSSMKLKTKNCHQTRNRKTYESLQAMQKIG